MSIEIITGRLYITTLPVSESMWPPPRLSSIGCAPDWYTFRDYLQDTPPVNSYYMDIFARLAEDKTVVVPCRVLSFDKSSKTALVRSSDGEEIIVRDLIFTVNNPCVTVLGIPLGNKEIAARWIALLPDNYDFERANFLIQYLMTPSVWGDGPPSPTREFGSSEEIIAKYI